MTVKTFTAYFHDGDILYSRRIPETVTFNK